MRAKFINEIRTEVEGSGLAPIGIGRTSLFRAYDYFRRTSPENVSDQTIEKFLNEVKPFIDEKKLEEFIAPPYSNYLKIEGISNNKMGDYLENLNGRHSTAFISKNDDDYYIHSFYNYKYNVGFFHEVVPKGSNYVYFVKYK
jgi:hypothetical protein